MLDKNTLNNYSTTNLSTEGDLRQMQLPPAVVHGSSVGGTHRRRPALHQVGGGGDGCHGKDTATA